MSNKYNKNKDIFKIMNKLQHTTYLFWQLQAYPTYQEKYRIKVRLAEQTTSGSYSEPRL